MAIRLLVALVALGLLHVMPQLARWRGDSLFRRWVAQLADTGGGGRVALALLLPLFLCALLEWLLGRSPLGELLPLLFALTVLLYCFGPREFESDLESILDAPDGARREAAAQALADDGQPIAWNAPALGEAIAYAALRRRFAVLLWFFLLGPVGALGYRLAQTLGRDALRLDPDSRRAADHVANALDWLPAQLLTFTLAVVGHWEAVIGAWRRWHKQAAATSWYAAGPGFLGAAAQADVLIDIEAGDGYAEEHGDPLAELRRLRSALLRALLAWLSVVALVVIGGWIG
ncbi:MULTISPECIES: regulatory signaling modulator protein AmpE [Rhodanobacter]|uniref:regulatory signaling modulator protein AmpE n=1 Tax=Rhodanobacter TaxID=75309 RepID=UPI0004245888|nr:MULTISPECIES: regulatory signaling modulator protein AmpE [Rhodanobacter]KZC19626.1 beta-lactamase induction protein [Rhodanobacter denitrificans]UJJ50995.1 regulatory signaling modulator protein AmpE [Rhodanobacter denitrificans]UJM93708.1 regulatory signaling modulator protein AmpE [Rhodanobacter denitrificans]UJM97239.1 regulatory signaling modulator protein AmpE [Rhodanobacter denitrificans]UJN19933.1 regulatory signaling modulator protein AmpE [Rhodanobacter denitrificans]